MHYTPINPTISMPIAKNSKKITIVGRGPAAMLAALELNFHNIPVTLIGPPVQLEDFRTTALMMPAITFLKKLNIWPELEKYSAPLSYMYILDATKRLIRSKHVKFSAQEIGESAFGYNIPNFVLNKTLHKMINKNKAIGLITDTIASYDQKGNNLILNGQKQSYQTEYIIAADGRQSLARNYANIEIEKWSYPQTSLILSFTHERPHNNTAHEFHTEMGPCTQVPLPKNQSSLVYVLTPEKAQMLKVMPIEQLELYIEQQLFSLFGKITIASPIQSWPLSAMKPKKYAQNNIFLIGEAAHFFPPIGAQGLNLTIRDIQALSDTFLALRQNPNQDSLKFYDQKRQKDVLLRTLAVNRLNKTLLSSSLSAQVARSFGLNLLDKLPFIRKIFMQEGMAPSKNFSQFLNRLTKKAN